jgi:hypothetical protein
MVLRLPLLAQLARSAPVRGAVFRQRRVFSTAAEDPAAEDPVQALIDVSCSHNLSSCFPCQATDHSNMPPCPCRILISTCFCHTHWRVDHFLHTLPPTSVLCLATLQKEISTHQVMIFSKSYCPFCDKVKAIFDERKNPYHAMELDERPDGGAIQVRAAIVSQCSKHAVH